MKIVNIPWCHSSVNPCLGCNGGEPRPLANVIALQIMELILSSIKVRNSSWVEDVVLRLIGRVDPSELNRKHVMIANVLALEFQLSKAVRGIILDILRYECAHYIDLFGSLATGPTGYGEATDVRKIFEQRMASAAHLQTPTAADIVGKPWLEGLPRLIFISDMENAWPEGEPPENLLSEILFAVDSPDGRRHIWLWFSNRPEKMAAYAQSLRKKGTRWPDNLVAMTTVTGRCDEPRVDELRSVPAKIRGLVLEPFTEHIELDLAGIDWLIIGGGGNPQIHPFHIERALALQQRCRTDGVAFFMKKVGPYPVWQGEQSIAIIQDGEDWRQWPVDWRERNFPAAFRHIAANYYY